MTTQRTRQRADYRKAPKAYKAFLDASVVLDESALGKKLVSLVFQRVSQLNGCAFCMDMHARELLAEGEDLQRLNNLSTWREVDFFSERECAALNWAEKVTHLHDGHVPDADFERLREHFEEREIVDLTHAVAVINAWNRLAVALRRPVARAALREAASAEA